MKKPNRRYRARAGRTVFAAFAAFAFGAAFFAARVGRAQQDAVGPVPQAVVTPEYTYLPGQPQMIAPAYSHITMHPQGRYALISCNEAASPFANLLSQSVSTPSALLLYDARLRRIRTVWEGHAPHRDYFVGSIYWLPQSDCALATVWDGNPTDDNAVPESVMATHPDKLMLLFFNFAQSLTGRTIALSDSPGNMQISVSPTKPYFYVYQDDNSPSIVRIGGVARGGTLGPAYSAPTAYDHTDFFISGWNAEGTAIYSTFSYRGDAPEEWFIWDGKTPNMTPLPAKPAKEKFARNLPQSPALVPTLTLRTGATVAVPASLPAQTPSNGDSKANAFPEDPRSVPPPAVLHPLYLEAVDATASQANPNRSTLIAPDADTSFLLPNQSAVLYQKGGATYVVPLTRIKNSAFVQLQKDVTMENARTLENTIFSYLRSRNSGGICPTKTQLTELVKKEREKEGDTEALLRGFLYTPPTGPLRDLDTPETVILGVLPAAKGRAIIYATGGVKWEDTP